MTLDTASGVYPPTLKSRDQWLTWKLEGGSRKVPRAPYNNPSHRDRYVNAHSVDNQTSFDEAAEWAETLPGHHLAYDIRDRSEHAEDLVLIDLDDVRDPETGEIHPTVADFLDRADTFAQVSSSGTGVHLIGRLEDPPTGVAAIESPLDLDDPYRRFPDAEIEGYWDRRFVGMTGEYITATSEDVTDITEFVGDLCENYATTTAAKTTAHRDPKPREELDGVEHTTDIQDAYDAIEQVRPRDIRLKSHATNERPDGKDLDPSWASSKSGTRLWQDADGWVYRNGLYALDALQVVALEEGLITSESAYPSGETFWRAVDALRDRGAHIPRLVDEEEHEALTSGNDDESLDSETKLALSGALAFRTTRRDYEYACPSCEHPVQESHATDCDLKAIDMSNVNQAYQTVIEQLDDRNRTLDALRDVAPGWSPVHTRVVEHLYDEDLIAPAGEEVVA